MERIRKGCRMYYTVVGHNGFHYPSNDNSYLATEEVVVNKLPWICSEGKVPVKVTLPDDPATIMWVEKKDLVATSLS